MADEKPRVCEILECGNDLSERSSLTVCATCRSSFYYWRKRRPAEILERRRRLTKYGNRMDTLMENGQWKRKRK